MRYLLASFIMAVLATACEAKDAEVPFSIQGEGYQCTLLQKDMENSAVSGKPPIEFLWDTDFYSDNHFELDQAQLSEAKMIVSGALQTFVETGWQGNIIGSHHTFQTTDSRYNLIVTDGLHSPETLTGSGAYYLEGALRIEGQGDTQVYNIKGFCRL